MKAPVSPEPGPFLVRYPRCLLHQHLIYHGNGMSLHVFYRLFPAGQNFSATLGNCTAEDMTAGVFPGGITNEETCHAR